MDPNATLDRMRELAKKILEKEGLGSEFELAQKVLDLDDWIRSGLVLPEDWVGNRECS